MSMIDLHVHTPRCGHASGAMDEYVEAARLAGVDTMAFCDHLPLPPGYPTGYSMPWVELPDYVRDVAEVAARSSMAGGPEVLLGIEADWIRGHEQLVAGALEGHPFDIVLGSVHFIDDWAFDDPELRDGYKAWSADGLWDRYFQDLVAAASSGLYDVMAHPDLIKKFDCVPESDPRPWFETAAAVFAERGVSIEVNTGGLRKPCAEAYPSLEFLKTCRRWGVAATVGSDAHAPREVAYSFPTARELLVEAGYRSVVVFRGRRAEEVAL
jgi:histidinol-phosphatase (PHP family)